ncbi:MAG: hypothetical protein [Bacteriophage sp.]|nr:MAG: hypothetical protein [Bacteriophage sp.]
MAERFIKYEKHGVIEKSSMLSTNYGRHIMNVVFDKDVDQGNVCVLGDYVEPDYFKAAVPAKEDAVLIVANEPKIYADYTNKMQEESNYFVGKGEISEVDDMDRFDIVTLSDESFDDDAAPAVGKYVVVNGKDYALTTVDDEPTGYGFVGKIFDIANNGRYRVLVQRNLKVEAAVTTP